MLSEARWRETTATYPNAGGADVVTVVGLARRGAVRGGDGRQGALRRGAPSRDARCVFAIAAGRGACERGLFVGPWRRVGRVELLEGGRRAHRGRFGGDSVQSEFVLGRRVRARVAVLGVQGCCPLLARGQHQRLLMDRLPRVAAWLDSAEEPMRIVRDIRVARGVLREWRATPNAKITAPKVPDAWQRNSQNPRKGTSNRQGTRRE